jgi:hypothetical protein
MLKVSSRQVCCLTVRLLAGSVLDYTQPHTEKKRKQNCDPSFDSENIGNALDLIDCKHRGRSAKSESRLLQTSVTESKNVPSFCGARNGGIRNPANHFYLPTVSSQEDREVRTMGATCSC